MTDTLTISGTYTYNASPGGPEVSEVFGSPVITPSTDPATLSYNESCGNVAIIAPAGVFSVPFGTLSSAKYVYIGTDNVVTVAFNGLADDHVLAVGGMLVLYNDAITAISITCGPVTAKVKYLLLGD